MTGLLLSLSIYTHFTTVSISPVEWTEGWGQHIEQSQCQRQKAGRCRSWCSRHAHWAWCPVAQPWRWCLPSTCAASPSPCHRSPHSDLTKHTHTHTHTHACKHTHTHTHTYTQQHQSSNFHICCILLQAFLVMTHGHHSTLFPFFPAHRSVNISHPFFINVLTYCVLLSSTYILVMSFIYLFYSSCPWFPKVLSNPSFIISFFRSIIHHLSSHYSSPNQFITFSHLERPQICRQSWLLTQASPWARAAGHRMFPHPCPSPWHQGHGLTRCAPLALGPTDTASDQGSLMVDRGKGPGEYKMDVMTQCTLEVTDGQ